MSRVALVALVLVSITAACEKKKEATGLPPASKWHAGNGTAGGGTGGGAGTVDPHAGMDMSGGDGDGDDPGTVDPHAGLDMSGAGGQGGADPHAGLDMSGGGGGGDMAPPAGPVDPNHFLRGTITVGAKAKDKVKAGGALFVSVKRPDPATGEPTGMPLVVEKLTVDPAGVAFDLSEANAMTGPGTVSLTGDVVIVARYDQDGDAFSKQPGDVSGTLRTTVPGKDLKVVLDTVMP